jgi:hypothetical protein
MPVLLKIKIIQSNKRQMKEITAEELHHKIEMVKK